MSDKRPIAIHIDAAEKRPELPEVGAAKRCENPSCPSKFEISYLTGGGGYVAYEYCKVCCHVVGKTIERD